MNKIQKTLSVKQVIGIVVQILIFIFLIISIFIGFGTGLQPKDNTLLFKTFTWTMFQMMFGYKNDLVQYLPTAGLIVAFTLLMVAVVGWMANIVLLCTKKGKNPIRISLTALIALCLLVAGILILCSKSLFYNANKTWFSDLTIDWATFKDNIKLGYATIISGLFSIVAAVSFGTYSTITNLIEIKK